MAEVNIEETISIDGKVFFAGKAVVSDADADLIKAVQKGKTPEAKQAIITSEDESPFPEDYPGFDVLGAVEGMTPEKLAAMPDDEVLAIKGIGRATLAEIRAYGK